MKIRRMDHVGIVVDDLPAAKAFFIALGLRSLGDVKIEGDWVERIIGLDEVKNEIVMLSAPGGSMCVELIKFHNPVGVKGDLRPLANEQGIRHIAFTVEDIDALVAHLQNNGTQMIGEIVNYEDSYKLCYVRGPEGMIIELVEKIG